MQAGAGRSQLCGSRVPRRKWSIPLGKLPLQRVAAAMPETHLLSPCAPATMLLSPDYCCPWPCPLPQTWPEGHTLCLSDRVMARALLSTHDGLPSWLQSGRVRQVASFA